jgi:hypothetical protein
MMLGGMMTWSVLSSSSCFLGGHDARRHDDLERLVVVLLLLLGGVVAEALALLGNASQPVPDELVGHRPGAHEARRERAVLQDGLVAEVDGDLLDEGVGRACLDAPFALVAHPAALLDELGGTSGPFGVVFGGDHLQSRGTDCDSDHGVLLIQTSSFW